MSYHVFISYRRDGGDAMARLLYERLRVDGYCPFLDVEQMRSGKFNEQLYERIAECEDFILVLPQNALDRCQDEKDWVRKEIQEAIRLNKNIVPFMLRGFDFPLELPNEIEEIRHYQGVSASQDYFDSTMDKLKKLLSYDPQKSIETSQTLPKHTIQIGKTVYEVDINTTRQDIIEQNKARRVKIGKTIVVCLFVLVLVSAITYCLNLLVRNGTNRVLDLWLYPNGERTVDSPGWDHPVLLMIMAALMFLPCCQLMYMGSEIESITLKILAVMLYVLTVLLLHLLPELIFVVVAIGIACVLLYAFLFG